MSHIHEKIDFVVSAWIVYNNRVLLVFHKEQKTWLPVGGHIESDEDPKTALLREVKEECGLDIEIVGDTDFPGYPPESTTRLLPRPAFVDIHPINEKHRHVALEYFAKAKTDAIRLAEDEHDEIRWFSADELEEQQYSLRPAIKFFAKEALKNVS